MSYLKKGNELYNLKDYKRAISMYEKALQMNENEAASLYNTAVCYIKLEHYKKAIPLLKSAIVNRKESRYFFNLAYCYAMTNNNKKALNYFNLAWCLDNNDSDCERAINLILDNYRRQIK